MNNRPQNYTVKTRLQKTKEDETSAQSEPSVNNSDFVPQFSASTPRVIEEVNNNQLTAAENSEATESTSETATTSVGQQQQLQQTPTEGENIVLPTNSELLHDTEDNIIEEQHLEQQPPEIQPIMAAGLNLPKYTGAESPIIWISKLEAWQAFHNYNDQKMMSLLPCALDGSASTWFQTLQPPCASLTNFKTALKERFQPATYGMPLMGIRQEPDETTDSYIERAERTGLGHALEEQYKVQATASGLLDMWRGKVLAREPRTFQELRTVIAKVKLEMSSSTPQQATSADNGITNLCAMLMTHMTDFSIDLEIR